MISFAPSDKRKRLSVTQYIELCRKHFVENWKKYSIPPIAVIALSFFFRIDINYTQSLPDHVFITVKGWKSGLKRGDYVAYKFPTEDPYSPFRKGDHMVKIIGGVAGDIVAMNSSRGFSVASPGSSGHLALIPGNDATLGVAKTHSKAGKPLSAGPVGEIPLGHYYVFAPHPDSLDSRYAMVGWISESDILGRTFSIF